MHITRDEFDTVINHFLGERMPGRPAQGIEALSTVQNYRTGSRLQMIDGVYHYGQAGGALVDNRLSFVENPQDAGMRVLGAAYAAGVTQVLLTLNNTEGPEQDGSVPLNYLVGGTVVFMTALGIYTRGIVGNALKAAGTGTFLVRLDRPTPFALVITDSTEIIASPYAAVVAAANVVEGSQLANAVGRACHVAADGDWLWFKTWGPIWVATNLTLGVGANNRSAYVVGDGAIQDRTGIELTGGAYEHQRVGTVMANAVGGGQGAPFVNLEIDP